MTLTNKQRVFIAEYLRDFNGTQAAIRAGYSPKTANEIAAENLAKPSIKETIQKAISERCMTADEVLMRLAEHARADLGEFVTNDGRPDIEAAKAAGKSHLIKKVTITESTRSGKDWESTVKTTSIELQDQQDALVQIGRHLKLFTDRHELDLDEATKQYLSAALRDGRLSPQDILLAAPDLAKELFAQAGIVIQEAE